MTTYSEQMLQFLNKQDIAQAELAFEKALHEDHVEVLEALGEALYQLGFIEKAKKVYLFLLKKKQEYPPYLLSLGELAIEENDIDLAFHYFDRISQDSPDYPAALLNEADLLTV